MRRLVALLFVLFVVASGSTAFACPLMNGPTPAAPEGSKP